MQQLPPPTSPTGGKGLLGSNILTSPTTSLGGNDPNDGGIVGQRPHVKVSRLYALVRS
ncbi:MAG TPA: hypothetical protein VFS97_11470 [Nitrososphaeraceae archaeon]|nr:hypothetical protein [Nitrososphaeraceae archaeon]